MVLAQKFIIASFGQSQNLYLYVFSGFLTIATSTNAIAGQENFPNKGFLIGEWIVLNQSPFTAARGVLTASCNDAVPAQDNAMTFSIASSLAPADGGFNAFYLAYALVIGP